MSCLECVSGGVHAGDPKGTIQILYGKRCYVTTALATPPSATTIVYITDAFGIDFINTKLLADQFAAETGFRVLVPDVIPGGGASASLITYTDRLNAPVSRWDVLGQLKRFASAVFTPEVFEAVPFFLRIAFSAAPHNAYPAKVLPFVRAVKAELPTGAKLGVVGFCWGGYSSTNLCKETAVEGGKERLVDVQFCGHPYSLETPEMILDAVGTHKVPYSMAIGDKDKWLHKDKVLETEAALRQKFGSGEGENGYNYEIKIYPGCMHGFVVRARPEDEAETVNAAKARAQAVEWLKKYL